jgi:beta-mannanase
LNQPDYALSTIADGAWDSYIETWAREAAAYGGPILIRFAQEMNGTWYPWSATTNGNTAANYVAAFQHIHDVFEQVGATNVKWVWSPNIVQGMPTPLSSVYPGSAYVDYVGIDGYNGGTAVPSMGGWLTPSQVFGSTLSGLEQVAPDKPVFINETGCAEEGGDKAEWITELFSYLEGTPSVVGLVWFDVDEASETNWRLDSSPASFAAAAAALTMW